MINGLTFKRENNNNEDKNPGPANTNYTKPTPTTITKFTVHRYQIIDKSNPKKKNKKANDKLLERIESLELAQNLIWKNHNNEKDPYKRTLILEKIVEL
jgi:hypothetical protein